jgi:hypothetical protein
MTVLARASNNSPGPGPEPDILLNKGNGLNNSIGKVLQMQEYKILFRQQWYYSVPPWPKIIPLDSSNAY